MQFSFVSDMPATVAVRRRRSLSTGHTHTHTQKPTKPKKKLKGFGFCFNRFLALVCWRLVIGLGYGNGLMLVKTVG